MASSIKSLLSFSGEGTFLVDYFWSLRQAMTPYTKQASNGGNSLVSPPERLGLQTRATMLGFLRSPSKPNHYGPNPFPSGGRKTLWVTKHITDYP